MARENLVRLYGQILDKPELRGSDGVIKRAAFKVKVVRRGKSASGLNTNLFAAIPVVQTRNPDLIEKIITLRQGDIVLIKGTFTTRDIVKKFYCGACGKLNEWEGSTQYVTPIHIMKVHSALSEYEGFQNIVENSEISNEVVLIGNVTGAAVEHTDDAGRNYSRITMAVQRKFRIIEDPETFKADFPIIRAYGEKHINEMRRLRTNSHISINGSIQCRAIDRTVECSCGAENMFQEAVSEVVPHYIGFLKNCDEIEETEFNGEE